MRPQFDVNSLDLQCHTNLLRSSSCRHAWYNRTSRMRCREISFTESYLDHRFISCVFHWSVACGRCHAPKRIVSYCDSLICHKTAIFLIVVAAAMSRAVATKSKSPCVPSGDEYDVAGFYDSCAFFAELDGDHDSEDRASMCSQNREYISLFSVGMAMHSLMSFKLL